MSTLSSLRQCLRLPRPSQLAITFPSVWTTTLREYHGDPGPTTSLNRKAARKQLRGNVRGSEGLVKGFGELEKMLEGQSMPEKHYRKPRESQGYQESSTRTPQFRNGFRNTSHSGSNDRPTNPSYGFTKPTYQTHNRNDPYFNEASPVRRSAATRLELADAPYATALRIQRWIHSRPRPFQEKDIESLYTMVIGGNKTQINVVSWNMLLGLLGQEGRLDRMWRAFNEMKKRGIESSTWTYSTLLNAYADSAPPIDSHSPSIIAKPEARTLSRVTNIFDQSQAHLKKVKAASRAAALSKATLADDDIGLATSSKVASPRTAVIEETLTPEVTDELTPVAINSYLKFLANYGMLEEMQRVFISMDPTGDLSPDSVTYTIMFNGLNKSQKPVYSYKTSSPTPHENNPQIGPLSRSFWDQAVRQFCRVDGAVKDQSRVIDEALAIVALQALMKGRSQDRRLAVDLIPRLWGLSTPGKSAAISPISTTFDNLPVLPRTITAATAVMNILRASDEHSLASHITQVFLDDQTLQPKFDVVFLKAAISNLSITGDIGGIMSILEHYQPYPDSSQWPTDVYVSGLRAARWSSNFGAALDLLRRATHLPPNIENGTAISSGTNNVYTWTPPNNIPYDTRGIKWVPGKPLKPFAYLLSAFLKAALNCGKQECQQSLNVLEYFGVEEVFSMGENGPGTNGVTLLPPFTHLIPMSRDDIRSIQARLSLAKEVQLVCEKSGVSEWTDLAMTMKAVQDYWGPKLESAEGRTRGGADYNLGTPPTRYSTAGEIERGRPETRNFRQGDRERAREVMGRNSDSRRVSGRRDEREEHNHASADHSRLADRSYSYRPTRVTGDRRPTPSGYGENSGDDWSRGVEKSRF